MKKILFTLFVLNVACVYGQEEKDIQYRPEKDKEVNRPQLQPGNNETKAPEKPEPPAYIYDTHLPPASRKKETEEAERRAYTRPEVNLPQPAPLEK